MVCIVEIVGVSVGLLYQYFEGKDVLVEVLMDKFVGDIVQGLCCLFLVDSVGLCEIVEGVICFGFVVLYFCDGFYLELVCNWYWLFINWVVDVLQQYFMELLWLYFIKYYCDYLIEDLQVCVFIVVNSVLFIMVCYVSQNDVLLCEDDIVVGFIDMVVGYMIF